MLNLILVAGLAVGGLQPLDASRKPPEASSTQRGLSTPSLVAPPHRRKSVFQWDARHTFPPVVPRR
jgi:hypothetical protein